MSGRFFPAGSVYFALTFAAGFVLGTIRETLLVPRIGPTAAVLVEAPVMLLVSAAAAAWAARRLAIGNGTADRLAMGLVALALLVGAEVLFSYLLRGLTPVQYALRLAAPPGLVSLALFAVFAAMPLLVARRFRG